MLSLVTRFLDQGITGEKVIASDTGQFIARKSL
jgi:hypothetical protein